VFKFSRRVFGVATALTLGTLMVAPSASAALLGSGGAGGLLGGSSGGLLAPVTGLLGSGGAGGLLGGVTDLGGLTSLGGLTNVGGLVGVGGLPLGGATGVGSADSAGGELLDGVFQSVGGTTLACDAAVPQVLSAFLGGAAGAVCALNPFDGGLAGLLGTL
jgi:hypothetical protein